MKTVSTFVLLCLATSAFGQSARDLVASSGVQGGLVVHMGSDGSFATNLLANDRFVVHGLCGDQAATAEAPAHVQRQGMYGKVSIQYWNKNYLPY